MTVLLGACSFTLGGGGSGGVVDADGDAPDGTPDADLDAPDAAVDAAIDAPPGPWLAGFGYRKPLQISPPGTGTLTDFPVGILLASDPDLAAHASGADLVVTANDMTTVLDSELVTFGAGGELELWVRVPALPLGATTTLYLYYGGPATTTDPLGVWPASVRGVWHLSDTTAGARDSTSRAHHLAQANASFLPGFGRGVGGAGRARVYDGVDDRLEVPDPADGSLDFGSQSFSVSLWARSTGSVGLYDQPLYKGGTSSSLPGYCLFLGSSEWTGKVHDGTSFVTPTFAAGPQLNQWVHVVMVIDRGTSAARAFMNGVATDSTALNLGSLSSGAPLTIGAGSGGARFQGSIDEVRIHDRVLSAAWIATEHANLTSATFVTVGSQQAF